MSELLINPPPHHWRRTPADTRDQHVDNDTLVKAFLAKGSRYPSTVGKIGIATVHSKYGFGVFDGTDRPKIPVIGVGQYTPTIDEIPWNDLWVVPAGSDRNVYVIDRKNDHLYMAWGAVYFGRVLYVQMAAILTFPENVRDRKGKRKDSGIAANYSTYHGNHRLFNGAGTILAPVTRAALDLALEEGREDLGHVLSSSCSALAFDFDMGFCPASKFENANKHDAAGLWWHLIMDDDKRNSIVNKVATKNNQRAYARIILNTLRKYGSTIDLTGPQVQVQCSDIVMPSNFPFLMSDPGIRVRFVEPCKGKVVGDIEDWSSNVDWYDVIKA